MYNCQAGSEATNLAAWASNLSLCIYICNASRMQQLRHASGMQRISAACTRICMRLRAEKPICLRICMIRPGIEGTARTVERYGTGQ